MEEKMNEIFEKCIKSALTPKCIYCQNSNAEECMKIKCTGNPKYKNKTIYFNDNFFSNYCEFFDPSEEGIEDMMEEAIDEGKWKEIIRGKITFAFPAFMEEEIKKEYNL